MAGKVRNNSEKIIAQNRCSDFLPVLEWIKFLSGKQMQTYPGWLQTDEKKFVSNFTLVDCQRGEEVISLEMFF